MAIKFSLIPVLGATMAISLLAQTKPEASPVDPAVLARLDGIMSLCTKTYPASADKFKEGYRLFTKDQPDTAVDDARKTKTYQDTLDQTNKQLEKVTPEAAEKACSAYLKGKQSAGSPNPR